jgi:hypothetical protein
MGTGTANKSIQPKPAPSSNLGADIRTTDYEDILISIANERISTKKNAGKTEFTAIVIKVLTESTVKQDRQLLTDLFLNREYQVEREENLTNASNSNNSIAFLHIPALHSYITSDTIKSARSTNDVTTTDLFLVPMVTNFALQPNQIIKVTFSDMDSFRGIRVVGDKFEKIKQIADQKRTINDKIVSIMKAREGCTKLQSTPPSGSQISPKTVLNPNNPLSGYGDFYSDYIKGIITSDNLRKQVILSLGSSQAEQKLFNTPVTPLSTDNIQNALIAESTYATFGVEFYVGSQEVKQYIEANDTATNFKNAESFPIKVAGPDIKSAFDFSSIGETQAADKENRSIYLKIVPLDVNAYTQTSKLKAPGQINQIIIESIEKYLAGVTRSKYNYSFETQVPVPAIENEDTFVAIDIFGKTTDDTLIDGNVALAIDYSKQKKRMGQSEPGNLQTVVSFLSQTKKPKPLPQQAGKASTATANTELNECQKTNKLVNESVYYSLEDDKSLQKTSYNEDNKLYKKIGLDPSVTDADSFLAFAINSNTPSQAKVTQLSSLTNSKLFNYQNNQEVISVIEEGKETDTKASNKKKATLNQKSIPGLGIGRGTNLEQLQKNGTELIKFAKAFRNFIANNEGVESSSVLLLPLSTFRPFIPIKKPGEGVDQNSRHFFNRAIDFVVYINTSQDFRGFGSAVSNSEEITKKDTFEIPNNIVYLYLLKFIKQNSSKFGQAGIGLLQRSQKRKTGYVHYEIMSDYREPEKGVQRAKRNRRWVSEPADADKSSIYSAAFDKENKDSIIKEHIENQLKQATGILPEKFQRIL